LAIILDLSRPPALSLAHRAPPKRVKLMRRFGPRNEAMLALSIRQPYAELILRGIKTVEYRTRSTRIIGERLYIYASKAKAAGSPRRPNGFSNWPSRWA